MVYLDHGGTTPLRPEARAAMLAWLGEAPANPNGVHAAARAARAGLDDARDAVANVLGVRPREVVFTSGGTEGLNTAVRGRLRGGVAVVSAIEHAAVREAAAAAERSGTATLVEAPVRPDGVLDLVALDGLLSNAGPAVALVAVMAVNNEVGTVQPIDEVEARVRRRCPGAALLVDAVCAPLWCELGPVAAKADLLALSGHKFGGPHGSGVLVVRDGVELAPLVHGGGQEAERRSGTQHVAGAAGLAAALVVAHAERDAVGARVAPLRDRLVDEIVAAVPGVVETGDRRQKVPGNAHLCIEGVESEALLVLLDRAGVAASAGSACASGALHASPVLLAMGIEKDRALGSLRLTLGPSTADADVDTAVDAVVAAVRRLRP